MEYSPKAAWRSQFHRVYSSGYSARSGYIGSYSSRVRKGLQGSGVKMFNAQVSMPNEWANIQGANALNHCYIVNSLKIDHCKLIIVSKGLF
jgi:hypothetical protein